MSQMQVFSPIERVGRLSYDEFHQDFDRPQRPVVIVGATSEWRAMKEWSHEWFKEHHGSTTVHLSREHTHTTKAASMRIEEYIDLVLTGKDDGFYMDQFSLDRIPGLESYVGTPYANPLRRHVTLNLWVGPAGTFISLHKDNHVEFDHTNNIFAQIRGRKRAVLVSPEYDALMYPRTKEQGAHWHSQVDWEHPDYERFPLFRGVRFQEAVLEPGEILFIPGNYWHSFRSLDPSISVSCWWRVHRIADVVTNAVKRMTNPSIPIDSVSLADIEDFGGAARVAEALEAPSVPQELRGLIWSVLEPKARAAIDASRKAGRLAGAASV